MASRSFGELPEDFEPTRATLQNYAKAVGVIARAHAKFHPNWWHTSLNVTPQGLETDTLRLPDSGICNVRMDLRSHEIVVETNRATAAYISMRDGLSGTEMGDALIAAVGEIGLSSDYARQKFESDEVRRYDADVAADYFELLTNVHALLCDRRAELDGQVGPVQLWPHGFDLSFEWFGTKMVEHEENGEVHTAPAQLNLGFYPGWRSYFYSNPWPFDRDRLLGIDLPHDAEWHTDGWLGSIYYYDQLAGLADADARIEAFARKVFESAKPTLMA